MKAIIPILLCGVLLSWHGDAQAMKEVPVTAVSSVTDEVKFALPDTALSDQYAEFLTTFLQEYNTAFEKLVSAQGWVLCDVKKGEVVCTLLEVDQQALRKTLLDMLGKDQQVEKGDDFEVVEKIAVAPTTPWNITEKFSWIPLYMFRKGLVTLLNRGNSIPAGLLSLLLVYHPAWISTVVVSDLLPIFGKKFAPFLVDQVLAYMKVPQQWADWLKAFLHSTVLD